MTGFKPINNRRASEEVLEQLRKVIFNGRYKAGDKLPSERELIEQFQVSRTVIREAIKGLEASGLVRIKQGATGGAFVQTLNFGVISSACHDLFRLGQMSFDEIYDARILIEPQVARLAAQTATPELVRALQQAADGEDIIEYPETVHARQKVHVLLADHCPNRLLGAIAKSLLELIFSIATQFEPDTDKIHPAGLHQSIIDAIANGDADAAEREMRQHLDGFLGRLQKVERDYHQS
ncbi:FadR/GntR family transcriptional regulator [Ferrimonas lipolytica]|uniref:FadR family transcriptional regulator n=1 Tax=Ferrimonas lipolytica TaxID=2724191 RepID=A0A6H1UF58_9GAMM|nr:FadR/GntR family transcriptional regulator [Ferrimonas lipolytica]QIZ77269.1 FadR family transcriptional regulator [Ferrimonas lipolytica]